MLRGQFRILLTLAMLNLSHSAWATWSIIIIDPKTGTIGIAGASCSPNCYGIGTIVPGKGVIIVQAMSNSDARAKGVQMILQNATPEEVIKRLRSTEFDPERQQYAVVTLNHMDPATYTGDSTHHARGVITAPGISVQGNTLTSEDVLRKVMDVIRQAQTDALSMEDTLMRALEAGSDAGGDRRCGEQRATSAFITVYRKGDSHRKPFLDLNTFGQKKGGQNAVVLLRKRFDRWRTRNKL